MAETWTPPDPPKARVEREYTALFRIHERHADSPARRARPGPPALVGPGEAVRLLVSLAAGSSVIEDGEEDVDAADLTAALTLMPRVRAEVDELEASLLLIASPVSGWREYSIGNYFLATGATMISPVIEMHAAAMPWKCSRASILATDS